MSTLVNALNDSVASFELRFTSLFHPGRGFAFPCDADGLVDMDAMSERARSNYLFVRALMGREYGAPMLREATPALH